MNKQPFDSKNGNARKAADAIAAMVLIIVCSAFVGMAIGIGYRVFKFFAM